MCLICVEFQRQRMTVREGRRALGEMVEKIGPEHANDVRKMLREVEAKGLDRAEETESDDELS